MSAPASPEAETVSRDPTVLQALSAALEVRFGHGHGVGADFDEEAKKLRNILAMMGVAILPRSFDTGNIKLIEAINSGGCQGWSGEVIPDHVRRARQHWWRILNAFAAETVSAKESAGSE